MVIHVSTRNYFYVNLFRHQAAVSVLNLKELVPLDDTFPFLRKRNGARSQRATHAHYERIFRFVKQIASFCTFLTEYDKLHGTFTNIKENDMKVEEIITQYHGL